MSIMSKKWYREHSVSFYATPEQKTWIKEQATSEGISISLFVGSIIEDYMEKLDEGKSWC